MTGINTFGFDLFSDGNIVFYSEIKTISIQSNDPRYGVNIAHFVFKAEQNRGKVLWARGVFSVDYNTSF